MPQTNISLENVIAALEACSFIRNPDCSKCYLDGPGFGFACRDQLRRDTLTLLKGREPIAPIVECDEYPDCTPKGFELNYCGACGDDIVDGQKFCSNCGRAVKWNG